MPNGAKTVVLNAENLSFLYAPFYIDLKMQNVGMHSYQYHHHLMLYSVNCI